jgi:hypothetical protein
VRLDGVLDRELMQLELARDVGELLRVGAVEADPRDSRAAAAGGVQLRQGVGCRRALAVPVDGTIDDHPPATILIQNPAEALTARNSAGMPLIRKSPLDSLLGGNTATALELEYRRDRRQLPATTPGRCACSGTHPWSRSISENVRPSARSRARLSSSEKRRSGPRSSVSSPGEPQRRPRTTAHRPHDADLRTPCGTAVADRNRSHLDRDRRSRPARAALVPQRSRPAPRKRLDVVRMNRRLELEDRTGELVCRSVRVDAGTAGVTRYHRIPPERSSGDRLLFISRGRSCSAVTPHKPETGKSSNDAGFSDGETRTRTGDTTIFRQMLRTLEQARKRLQISVFLAPG